MNESANSVCSFLAPIPARWSVLRFKNAYAEINQRSVDGEEDLLSVSEYYGVAPRRSKISAGDSLSRADSLEGYKKCSKGDLVMNIMLAWKRGLGVTKFDGIVSPAYCVFRHKQNVSPDFMHYLLRTDEYTSYFKSFSSGVIDSRLRLYPEQFGQLYFGCPPLPEQRQIAAYLNRETSKIDKLIAKQQKLIKLLQEKRQAVISQAVTKGLDPNVKMKGSGVEWLGEIPESWQIFSLKKIARLNDGNHGEEYPTKEDFVEENQGVPFIRPGNISNFQVLSEGMVYISEEKNRAMRKGGLRTGDILFTNRGEIGKIALIDEEYDGANLNSQVAYLRISDRKVNHIFLLFSLSSTWIKSQVSSKLGGSVLTQFPLKDLGNLLLPLPSIDEQEKIVTELKSTISKIEKLNTSAQNSIHLMKERRQALITAAVTGKIDVRGLVTDEEVAALDQEPDETAFSDEEITDLENESADDELTA